MVEQVEILLPEYPRGFHLISEKIESSLNNLPIKGVLHLFIQHTSAGITINENADASVRYDIETFMNKLVPESENDYTHTMEGLDDMPAHIKAALIGSSIMIPIKNGQLQLGTWQGIFLAEFRNRGGRRRIIASILT